MRTVASLPEFSETVPALNRWGGRTDRAAKSTGFFHARKIGDRWWMVDPDGGLFLHVGVDSVIPGKSETNRKVLSEVFGSPEMWALATTDLFRDLGFNGLGSWSDIVQLRDVPKPLVYTIIGVLGKGSGFMTGFGSSLKVTRPGAGHTSFPNECMPLFHPDFSAFCDTFARPLAANSKDAHLLGYFSDNELPMPRLEKYLSLPPDNPAMGSTYRAAKAWLDARKGKSATEADITDEDRDAWTEYAYDRYLSVTTAAIRKYDPNHLCLGPRFYGAEKKNPGTWRAAGRHLDVIAINHYGVWDPMTSASIANYSKWSGKPVIVTEFYAKGADSGFANTGGAGWLVPTQEDRGLFYETFALGLLQSKNCVGWHWFKYMDNDPAVKTADLSANDSNKGIVTNRYVPYAPLADHMRQVNRRIYAIADYFDAPQRTVVP